MLSLSVSLTASLCNSDYVEKLIDESLSFLGVKKDHIVSKELVLKQQPNWELVHSLTFLF